MKIKDLFILHQGNGFELCNMNVCEKGNINFISRTAQNNGVVAHVCEEDAIVPFPTGCITVALGGSVLASFVQTRPFYTAYHIMVLEPKRKMTINEKLFYCMCIQKNAYRYNYGRQANKTLKDIIIPDDVPNWIKQNKLNYMRSKIERHELDLKMGNWAYFKLGGENGIFDFEACKCGNAGELDDGDAVFYIGAKKNDNGVMKKVAYEEKLITKGNCIIFICDGQGSVGYTNYMDRDFIGSTTLTVGRNKNLNKYIGLFLVTILDRERPKYSYGRKYRKHLENTIIKLPSTNDGQPDYDFMERYIRSLPFSDRI